MFGLTKVQKVAVEQSRTLMAALRIMQFARRTRGATIEEFLDGLGVRSGCLHPRLYELLHAGCLEVIGRRETRTGRLARVYRIVGGATFARYLELRRIRYSKKTSQGALTKVERAVLAAGMQVATVWRSGTVRQRRNALVRLVKDFNRISKLRE